MAKKRLSISAAAFLAGAVVGLPLTAARADEPTTAPDAEAAAQAARKQADHYRELGGVGYKAGLVHSSEAEAARYDAMAQTLAPTPTVTEQMMDYKRSQKLESHLEAIGGVAFKSQIDEQAKAKEQALDLAEEPVQTPNPSCQPTKPAVDFACKEQQKRQEQQEQQHQ
jgi:hypothetical protein